MSWRVTLPCNRAEGEAVGEMDDPFEGLSNPPVIVADEPDEHRPDDWLIHAYFEKEPGEEALALLDQVGRLKPRPAMRIEDLVMRKEARGRLGAESVGDSA